ncbi:MAG: terminase family protein [Pyrinomonadaceae bacterium]|nr:terminase family protein [Pyrinomonadaceae bacterium]
MAPTIQIKQITAFEAMPGTPQEVMIACPFEDLLFGGARGGGKTYGMLGDWLSHADLYGANAYGVFFRKTYPELEQVQEYAQKIFPLVGGVYKGDKRTWIFPNGAKLKMRYLERDSDADRYQGHEYTWMCFEEIVNWASPKPIDKLRACLRSGAGVPCYFRATGNPGGVGHNWVKARYVDPAPARTPFYDEEQKVTRIYIPATLDDNTRLLEADPNYWKRIEASANGDEQLLRAWRYGDWDIVAGGMLDDVFDRTRHIIKGFQIPFSWYVDRTFDWGSSSPFSVIWWAESDGTTAPNGITYPRGTVFAISEWYGWNGKPNEGNKLLAHEIADGIIEREQLGVLKNLIINDGAADTQIWQADPLIGISIADEMAERGVSWLKADKTPGSRKQGWQRLRRFLKAAKQHPMEDAGLFVFDNCTQWIRTVPVLPRYEKDRDDVDPKAEDHAGDATRYRLSYAVQDAGSYETGVPYS